jgi:hypothetical protein
MLNEPKTILDRLAQADREHQKEAAGRLALEAVKYFCALVLALFVLDMVLQLKAGWRLGLSLLTLAGLAAFAWYLWRLGYVRRNRLEHIARFLEERDPALGSQLINLLQLRKLTEDESIPPVTRDLARLAVESYAGGLNNHPLEQLAWTGELRRYAWRAAIAGGLFLALLAAFFPISKIEIARFADPLGDHPPYSFTRLQIVTPGQTGTNVLYGKSLVVKVLAEGHQPKEVFLTAFPPGHPEQATTVPMFDKGKSGFDQLIDNIRTELVVCAHTRNSNSISKQARIHVLLTPKLEKAFVQIAPPAYTQLPAEEKPYTFQGVQALEGSTIRFRFQSNRPLRQGGLEILGGEAQPQRLAMTRTADKEVSGSFVISQSGRLRFNLTDVDGLPSQDDWEGPLTVTHDLPPEIKITEPERDVMVSMDFALQAHMEASDDYGLKKVRIHIGVNGKYPEPREVVYNPPVRNSVESADLYFSELGVNPGDMVSLFAEAIDTAPQPHLARSQTVHIRVISVEDYNDLLRERSDLADTEAKYQGLMDELQDLIERQRQLGEESQDLKSRLAKVADKDKDDLTRQLDNLLAKQNELNEKLNKQADRMENFVRPNPTYDVELDLQAMLKQKAEQIRQSTESNQESSKEIAEKSSPSSGKRQLSPNMADDFKKASDDQIARLTNTRESAESEITQTLEDMSQMQELQKDFGQFEDLYNTQKELAAQAQAYNRAGQLSREDQLALKELAATQKQVGDLLSQLQDKLLQDAEAAEKLFPKAAKSAKGLSKAMGELRLGSQAHQATGKMLDGNGEQSFHMADRLRDDMESLFSECQGGNCPSSQELDIYLSLQRSLKPGKNFAQMGRSRKFGKASGSGMGAAPGEGMNGSSGYAIEGQQMMDVLGNEQKANPNGATARQSSRFGKGNGLLARNSSAVEPDKTDTLKGLKPVNRQSGAVSSETGMEEYHDVVDSYFKAITTRKKP